MSESFSEVVKNATVNYEDTKRKIKVLAIFKIFLAISFKHSKQNNLCINYTLFIFIILHECFSISNCLAIDWTGKDYLLPRRWGWQTIAWHIYFINKISLQHTHELTMAVFMIATVWPTKPKILTYWPFIEKVCWSLAQNLASFYDASLRA